MSDATNPESLAQRKRLHWHSRRGMWELDLLLIPFLEHCYDHLDAQDRTAYQALIEEEDQDLFAWLLRREEPEDPSHRRIVTLIQAHAENAENDPRRPV